MAEGPQAIEFTMYSARSAMTGGLSHIEEHIKALERAVVENSGLAFDLAKTVIESACRTILSERNILFDSDDDLPKLFKLVTTNLPLLPVAVSSEAEARKSLARTLSGLHTALQGVCELRNAYGFASHGVEGPRPLMESVQALLAAQAADTIIGFLHRMHLQDRAAFPGARLEYEDSAAFNEFVDDSNSLVQIFNLEYRASEVLFSIDREAYRDKLADFESEGSPPELPEQAGAA